MHSLFEMQEVERDPGYQIYCSWMFLQTDKFWKRLWLFITQASEVSFFERLITDNIDCGCSHTTDEQLKAKLLQRRPIEDAAIGNIYFGAFGPSELYEQTFQDILLQTWHV